MKGYLKAGEDEYASFFDSDFDCMALGQLIWMGLGQDLGRRLWMSKIG